MKLIDFFEDGNHFFNTLISYPAYVTQPIQEAVEDIARYDYGMRSIRPYLKYLTTREDGQGISPSIDAVIKSAVLSFCKRYEYKFSSLFESETFEYDPIENYNMTEIMTDDTTETTYGKKDTRTLDKDSSDTRTYNLTDERTPDLTEERTPDLTETHTLNNLTSTETDQVAGFNSAVFNDANKKTSVGTGSETTTDTGSETTTTTGTDTSTRTGTDTLTYSGTDTDTSQLSGKDINVRNYELTRKGNIGVQTTMDMIQKFRDIADFSALQEFAHCLVNELTIGVY